MLMISDAQGDLKAYERVRDNEDNKNVKYLTILNSVLNTKQQLGYSIDTLNDDVFRHKRDFRLSSIYFLSNINTSSTNDAIFQELLLSDDTMNPLKILYIKELTRRFKTFDLYNRVKLLGYMNLNSMFFDNNINYDINNITKDTRFKSLINAFIQKNFELSDYNNKFNHIYDSTLLVNLPKNLIDDLNDRTHDGVLHIIIGTDETDKHIIRDTAFKYRFITQSYIKGYKISTYNYLGWLKLWLHDLKILV